MAKIVLSYRPDGDCGDADKKTWSSFLLMSLTALSRRSIVAADDTGFASVKRW